MNFELLNWFGNFINFTIFIYLVVGLLGSNCFNVFQLSLSLFGLLSSISIQMMSVFIKYFGDGK